MRQLHRVVGVLVVIAFLLTGQYMEFKYGDWVGTDDAIRLMYRSRHVYIVMAGMVNIAVGLYFTWQARPWRRVLQMIGSGLILTTPFAMIAAFFYEPAAGALARQFTGPSVILLFSGVVLHLVSATTRAKTAAITEEVESQKQMSSAATGL
jgi:hypothetical protein